MGDVINFPPKTMQMHRKFCDDCASVLEYWIGDDDMAYGICTGCMDLIPSTIEFNEELIGEE
jgi:hypothetical protein|tara:strand:- start:1841 stop:2026 length:186 start_codon:yes stop_codon:yes gene_type:complete